MHKVSLYADDLLLFLSNPLSSIPQTLSILDIYSSFSGYKLHFCKSELFPLNSPSLQISYSDFQFKVIRNRFKYLGIQVTCKYSDLFSANISPLHNHVKSLFMSWKCLPLSLIRRVNVIKMNVLPKFLYLFLYLSQNPFFTILQRNISSFIWNKSKRINQSHLMKPKCLGGLALPNFQTYYWAANIRSLLYWVQQDLQLKEYQWVRMEAASCVPATLTSLLSVPVSFKYTTLINKKTVVKHSLRIWSQFRLALDLKDPCITALVFCNISFPPSLMDGAFNIWREHGLATVSQLYIANNFASFTQLVI